MKSGFFWLPINTCTKKLPVSGLMNIFTTCGHSFPDLLLVIPTLPHNTVCSQFQKLSLKGGFHCFVLIGCEFPLSCSFLGKLPEGYRATDSNSKDPQMKSFCVYSFWLWRDQHMQATWESVYFANCEVLEPMPHGCWEMILCVFFFLK